MSFICYFKRPNQIFSFSRHFSKIHLIQPNDSVQTVAIKRHQTSVLKTEKAEIRLMMKYLFRKVHWQQKFTEP